MTDNRETAARAEPSAPTRPVDKPDEDPSPSTASAAAAEAAERPSLFTRIAGLFRHRNGASLREELVDVLAEAEEDAEAFSPNERAMLNNILRLREVRVEDLMIPRADIEAVEITIRLGELLSLFETSGHSRMPVFSGSLDDPRGMVHIRDLLAHITREARGAAPESRTLDLSRVDLGRSLGELDLLRPLLFVPPSMLASDLMSRMQSSRTQMALVIDEYGGTDGLVSLEDIVETVVGDIADEHDQDEALIEPAGDDVFVVDGKADLEEVAEVVGPDFAPGEHADYVDTVGGLVIAAHGRVPQRGQVVPAIPGFEFHVLDADPRRVKRVRIVRLREPEERRAAAG